MPPAVVRLVRGCVSAVALEVIVSLPPFRPPLVSFERLWNNWFK